MSDYKKMFTNIQTNTRLNILFNNQASQTKDDAMDDLNIRNSLMMYRDICKDINPNELMSINTYLMKCEIEGIMRGLKFAECNFIIIDEHFYSYWKNYKSTDLIMKKVKPQIIICMRQGETVFKPFMGYISSDFLLW